MMLNPLRFWLIAVNSVVLEKGERESEGCVLDVRQLDRESGGFGLGLDSVKSAAVETEQKTRV